MLATPLADWAHFKQWAPLAHLGQHLNSCCFRFFVPLACLRSMTRRAEIHQARLFVVRKVIHCQSFWVVLLRPARHRPHQFHTPTCRHLDVFVARISGIGLNLLWLKARVFKLIQDRLNRIRILLTSCLRNHRRDQLHLILIRTSLADLHLIARTFVAVVSGIKV